MVNEMVCLQHPIWPPVWPPTWPPIWSPTWSPTWSPIWLPNGNPCSAVTSPITYLTIRGKPSNSQCRRVHTILFQVLVAQFEYLLATIIPNAKQTVCATQITCCLLELTSDNKIDLRTSTIRTYHTQPTLVLEDVFGLYWMSDTGSLLM